MVNDLTPYEHHVYRQRIRDAGIGGLVGIEVFQAYQLKESLENSKARVKKDCFEAANLNPNYPYPERFINDHLGYWLDNQRYTLNELDFLINTVEEFINNPSEEPKTNLNKPKKLTGLQVKTQEPNQSLTPTPKGYSINLTDEELKALYQKLVDAKYLKPTNDEHFVNAFNGRGNSFEKLEWIDIASRRKMVSIQTLFQLLSSCKVPLRNEHSVITDEVKAALQEIFVNEWGNIGSKMNDFKELITDRHKEVNRIVLNLKSY